MFVVCCVYSTRYVRCNNVLGVTIKSHERNRYPPLRDIKIGPHRTRTTNRTANCCRSSGTLSLATAGRLAGQRLNCVIVLQTCLLPCPTKARSITFSLSDHWTRNHRSAAHTTADQNQELPHNHCPRPQQKRVSGAVFLRRSFPTCSCSLPVVSEGACWAGRPLSQCPLPAHFARLPVRSLSFVRFIHFFYRFNTKKTVTLPSKRFRNSVELPQNSKHCIASLPQVRPAPSLGKGGHHGRWWSQGALQCFLFIGEHLRSHCWSHTGGTSTAIRSCLSMLEQYQAGSRYVT